jgi:hypothetical protein
MSAGALILNFLKKIMGCRRQILSALRSLSYLFVAYLTTLSMALMIQSGMNNELERLREEVVGPNLRYYPGICLEGLWKTTRNRYQDSRSQGRDLNPRRAECEECVPTTHYGPEIFYDETYLKKYTPLKRFLCRM